MKRTGLVILFLLMVCIVASAGAVSATPSPSSIIVDPPTQNVTSGVQNPWTVEELSLYSLQPYDKGDKRVQSFCGPSNTYHGAGAYKTYKMTRIQGVFIEDGYILVDMDYSTVGKRRVYFKTSAFSNTTHVPQANITGFKAITTSDVIPRFGPGIEYDSFTEAALNSNTSITVLFEEHGYVFAEFDSALGIVRGWIDTASVQAD